MVVFVLTIMMYMPLKSPSASHSLISPSMEDVKILPFPSEARASTGQSWACHCPQCWRSVDHFCKDVANVALHLTTGGISSVKCRE